MRFNNTAIAGAGSGPGHETNLLFNAEGAAVVITEIEAGRTKVVANQIVTDGGSARYNDVTPNDEYSTERCCANDGAC